MQPKHWRIISFTLIGIGIYQVASFLLEVYQISMTGAFYEMTFLEVVYRTIINVLYGSLVFFIAGYLCLRRSRPKKLSQAN